MTPERKADLRKYTEAWSHFGYSSVVGIIKELLDSVDDSERRLEIAVEAMRYAQRETLSAAISSRLLETLAEIDRVRE